MWHRRKDRERDLERELQSDLELEAEELQEHGLTAEDARYAARRAFGNTTLVKEEVREMWGWTRWEILMQDFRYGLRNLCKSPGFALTAFLTLALGIGASTAVFTVVDSVLLKPLGYGDSGRLTAVWERVRALSGDPLGPNPRHVEVWQKRTGSFESLTYLRHVAWGLSVGNGHPRLTGAVVCLPNLFEVLRVQPLIGRAAAEEAEVRGHNLAILTYPLWQSLFHGDPGVIGKTIVLNDTPREVIGVLPPDFHFPNANGLRAMRSRQQRSEAPEPAVFLPVIQNLSQFTWDGNYGNWICLGRLRRGVTTRQAEAELDAMQTQLLRDMPGARDRRPGALLAAVQPMQEAIVGNARTGLWLLMAAVMGVLLIACLNLANAQLGRALARSREAAMRMALGAGRWRLLWSALAENLVLAAAGGAAGILLAMAGLRLFKNYSRLDLARPAEVHLNGSVLLFSMAVTLGASLLCGVLPAIRLMRADPQTALRGNQSRAAGRQSHAVRQWLIGLQVFGCTALLLVTGLFSKSLLHLLRQEQGFETSGVAVAEVMLPTGANRNDQSRLTFDDGVLENIRAIPGVQAAGLVSAMPLEGESWIEPLRRMDRPELETPLVNVRFVSAGYFEALRERLIAGRFFTEHDGTQRSVVVSEGEAKAVWGAESPVGQQVRLLGRAYTVVGVVADSRNTSLKSGPPCMAYAYYRTQPQYSTYFLARSNQPAAAFLPEMREAIWKYNPEATVARVKTLDAQRADSVATERFQTEVLAAFGIAALFLAMLGIYGVLSYSVTTRRQEIGVRMALGAKRSSVYALTFGEAGVPVVGGIVAGLGASVAAGRTIRDLLFGVQVIEPAVVGMVVALFLAAAVVAAYVPARRAASVDPMDALRAE